MEQKPSPKVLQVANIVAFLVTVVVNALSATVGILGATPGELSDAIPNLFVPSGLTFSVWSVIYLGLLLFTLQQSRGLFSAKREPPSFVGKVGWLFVLSAVANVGWIFLWHARLVGLSLVAMLGLLASLLAIYLRLGTGRTAADASERWLARVPFSLYLGWITVATIANATALLVVSGWNGWGVAPEVWAIVMIVAAVLIALAVLITRRDAAYALVVVWALAGIALKRSADPSAASHEVYIAAVAAASAVAAGLLVAALRSTLRGRPSTA